MVEEHSTDKIVCPFCKEVANDSTFYEYDEDDVIECPNTSCERKFKISSKEYSIHFTTNGVCGKKHKWKPWGAPVWNDRSKNPHWFVCRSCKTCENFQSIETDEAGYALSFITFFETRDALIQHAPEQKNNAETQ